MRSRLLTSLGAVVRPAWADAISHCPLIVCSLTPKDPLDIDHRSCVQDTAFFLLARDITVPGPSLFFREVAQATSAIIKGLDRSVLIHFQHSLKDVEPPTDR